MTETVSQAWLDRKVAEYERQGARPGSQKEADLLRYWRRERPLMYARLGTMAAKFAFVLVMMEHETMMMYVKAGMPPTDAEEQAQKEWLLMEPESASHKEPLSDRISSLMTLPG